MLLRDSNSLMRNNPFARYRVAKALWRSYAGGGRLCATEAVRGGLECRELGVRWRVCSGVWQRAARAHRAVWRAGCDVSFISKRHDRSFSDLQSIRFVNQVLPVSRSGGRAGRGRPETCLWLECAPPAAHSSRLDHTTRIVCSSPRNLYR